jgi:hypothetical protein
LKSGKGVIPDETFITVDPGHTMPILPGCGCKNPEKQKTDVDKKGEKVLFFDSKKRRLGL